MSAQLRPEAAPPRRTVLPSVSSGPVPASPAEPGEVAFEAWLRRELRRLHDATLAEPVPEELARLLDRLPPKAGEKKG